jgi:hypothetical protein
MLAIGFQIVIALVLISGLSGRSAAEAISSARQMIALSNGWEFRRDSESSDRWRPVPVPSSFQDHEGIEFHGVGWYRRKLEPISLPEGKRVLIHFQAVATETEVFLDGKKLGSHLGGWTPFRFDLTDVIRTSPPGKSHELLVRVDEKVGHNTQGFLPIIAPHFGGMWQEPALLIVPENRFDDLQLMSIGDLQTGELKIEVPTFGGAFNPVEVSLQVRRLGQQHWTSLKADFEQSGNALHCKVKVPGARPWSPAEPNLYEIQLALPGSNGDRVQTRCAFRSIEAVGDQFRLNGKPLNIRGLLNWGYSPPHNSPNPGEAAWREELAFAKARGFNLMKFCLWIPPQRYLELADEMGMLAWMEYPTWHPTLTERYLDPLRHEFSEFFAYDRNHPSVILRSLTCETGPSADLNVIKQLYNSAHAMIPGSLVEDDSSWIEWNRVNDFYDDHPYGNNRDWVKRLEGFNQYILEHGKKPLVLGEATAADTWVDRPAILARLGTERPWWAPGALDEMEAWSNRMTSISGLAGLDQLLPDSLRYGMLMRKYQVEAFRRVVPNGGNVISVIRDFSTASMGLLDYLGRPKWSEKDWAWQRDTMCLLRTENDRRSFSSGEPLNGELLISHFGASEIENASLNIKIESEHPGKLASYSVTRRIPHLSPGTLSSALTLDYRLSEATWPERLVVNATLKWQHGTVSNQWPLWVLPARKSAGLNNVRIHSSLAPELAASLLPGCAKFEPGSSRDIVVASRFDDDLIHHLEAGGKVLFLPDGLEKSLPLADHWFLRGAPYIPAAHTLNQIIPRDLWIELQHFDLASKVIPELPHLEFTDPVLLLWDTHDLKTVKTHGLVFETRAGGGTMLVSALRHEGNDNAAGRWLFNVFLDYLRSGAPAKHGLPEPVWGYLTNKMHADQTNLVSRVWRFKPDPKNEGLALGWQSPDLTTESDWKDIRIGAYWESQGYPDLDDWAWYRLWVDIPEAWKGRPIYLSFEGVDDMYELYVNGSFAGKYGDKATRQDALNIKKSHDISRFVTPGQKALVAVRVQDWQGAGGIYRPVTLGTLPFSTEMDWLR